MVGQSIVFPRRIRPPAEPAARGTCAHLPPELLTKARNRLQFLAGLIFVLCILSSIIEYTLGAHLFELYLLFLTVMATSAAIYLICRSHRIPHSVVLRFGLVYEVVICFAISGTFNWLYLVAFHEAPLITWSCIWIVVFPLIIPSRPRTTLVVAVLAAITSPLSLMSLHLFGAVQSMPYDYFLATVSPALCVIIATASSKVIYGMSLDVARAQELGSYKLVEILGKGGMGEVWLAKHKMLARPAAIKLISTQAISGSGSDSAEALVQRFEREAQATAMLQSQHTVSIYDFGVTDDRSFYYVMELMHGKDLDNLVKQFGPIEPERAVSILHQVCHSLAEAHQNGMVHRDIKPANIFLCKKGLDYDYVKVLDFGLVKTVFSQGILSEKLTFDGSLTGTPAYIAPELALGKQDIDGRADLYALGCVAYWLLTGCLVFESDTPMGMVLDHVKTEPICPSTRVEIEIPPTLEQIVLNCLAKDPNDRPQSAKELAERLSTVDFSDPWTNQRAEAWWRIHLPKK